MCSPLFLIVVKTYSTNLDICEAQRDLWSVMTKWPDIARKLGLGEVEKFAAASPPPDRPDMEVPLATFL